MSFQRQVVGIFVRLPVSPKIDSIAFYLIAFSYQANFPLIALPLPFSSTIKVPRDEYSPVCC